MVRSMGSQSVQADTPITGLPQRWLVISHAFNMDGRAASLTVTDKIPALRKAGIQMRVLSAITGRRDREVPHHQLLPLGPSALRFDFRHWLSQRVGRGLRYRCFTIAVSVVLAPAILLERLLVRLSSNWSWGLSASMFGRALARRGEFDLIFSSGGEWSAHWAAARLHRATGVPWIAEIHDPLVVRTDASDDGKSPRTTREGRFLQRLEADICEHAACVWWFTEAALRWARIRNPGLGDRGFVVRPGAAPPSGRWARRRGDTMRIGHFGLLSATRPIGCFLLALRRALDANPGARIELHLFGGTPATIDIEQIRKLGLEDSVRLRGRMEQDPGNARSGRDQIHEHMQQQDALLLLHGQHEGCTEYIPSKFYEYLWARRPILALTHHNPELDDLVVRHGGMVAAEGDVRAIEEALVALWMRWAADDLPESGREPIGVQQAVDSILQHAAHAVRSIGMASSVRHRGNERLSATRTDAPTGPTA